MVEKKIVIDKIRYKTVILLAVMTKLRLGET